MENDVKKMIRAKVSNVLTFLKEDKGKGNIFHCKQFSYEQ